MSTDSRGMFRRNRLMAVPPLIAKSAALATAGPADSESEVRPELYRHPAAPFVHLTRISHQADCEQTYVIYFQSCASVFGSPSGYKVRWPRPRTVGSGHGRSRRGRLWGTFTRVRAHGRYTIRRGYASVSSLASLRTGNSGAFSVRPACRVMSSGQRPCPQWCVSPDCWPRPCSAF